MSDRELLPSSIPRQQKVDLSMSRSGIEWLYLYCASCGRDGGRVLKTDVPNREEFAFYLCDPCAEKYGQIAGTFAVPDVVFWQKVKDAIAERHKRELSAPEIIEGLKDSDDLLAKLARDRNTFLSSE